MRLPCLSSSNSSAPSAGRLVVRAHADSEYHRIFRSTHLMFAWGSAAGLFKYHEGGNRVALITEADPEAGDASRLTQFTGSTTDL